MEKQDYAMIKIYKKVVGSLNIKFHDYQNPTVEQILTIPSEQEFKPMPLGYVVSMFYNPATLRMYNDGYWTLNKEDKEKVIARAEELGLYFGKGDGPDDLDQPEILYSEREIRSLLERKRVNEIKKIIDGGSKKQRELLAGIAKEIVDELDGKTIRLIEDGLKTPLVESDE